MRNVNDHGYSTQLALHQLNLSAQRIKVIKKLRVALGYAFGVGDFHRSITRHAQNAERHRHAVVSAGINADFRGALSGRPGINAHAVIVFVQFNLNSEFSPSFRNATSAIRFLPRS